jgi:hypothetical protein
VPKVNPPGAVVPESVTASPSAAVFVTETVGTEVEKVAVPSPTPVTGG